MVGVWPLVSGIMFRSIQIRENERKCSFDECVKPDIKFIVNIQSSDELDDF
jgi:hypothetical protein